MPRPFLSALSLLAAALLWAVSAGSGSAPASDEVVVNGYRLNAEDVEELTKLVGSAIPAARYWYDPISGWWGYEGGPVSGAIAAKLPLGGPLAESASRGTSGIFVNGRQLSKAESFWLSEMLEQSLAPGRYRIDDEGRGGPEGEPAAFWLKRLMRQKRRLGGSIGGGLFTYEFDPESTEWPGFRIAE